MDDPYKALGVARDASQEAIKNAYRGLAKKFHPDLNPKNKEAEHKFKEVSSAYEILGDPANRAKFDRGEWGAAAAGEPRRRHGGPFYREARGNAGGGRYSGGFEGFDEDVFANLFGGRGRNGGEGFAMPGQDELYRLDISLKESVEGGTRELQLPNGKRLAVKIPKGIVPGQKVRFAGQGGAGHGGAPSGDAYVELQLAPDDRFSVEGSSLSHDQPVPFDVALLGGQITVPTPEGQVRLNIPARTSSGRRLRIAGKGIYARGGQRGDLFVRVLVSLPETEDPALEAAVREWRERAERKTS